MPTKTGRNATRPRRKSLALADPHTAMRAESACLLRMANQIDILASEDTAEGTRLARQAFDLSERMCKTRPQTAVGAREIVGYLSQELQNGAPSEAEMAAGLASVAAFLDQLLAEGVHEQLAGQAPG